MNLVGTFTVRGRMFERDISNYYPGKEKLKTEWSFVHDQA